MAHLLVVCFPLQSHVNPTLEFASRLARAGARVTFLTTVSALRRMVKRPAPPGLSYASFSDGYDDGFTIQLTSSDSSSRITVDKNADARNAAAQFSEGGTRKISELVRTLEAEGRPIAGIVYTISQTWVADLAHELQILAVPLWIQPAAVLAVYYHYFDGYDSLINRLEKDPGFLLELPNMPPLACKDIPSFLLPSDPNLELRDAFRKQFETFKRETGEGRPKPRVLVNTFNALEQEAISSVGTLNLICIGPLNPSEPHMPPSERYLEWLGSKPGSSVVYIAFGSILCPGKMQREAILNGLLESGRPFLWVIKGSDTRPNDEFWSRVEGCGEGLVVPWCSQVEVLSHPSTGCFVTHCGWNSTVESLAAGVPMVCFPQWTDQMTNAKMVEDVWKGGVRVKLNEDGVLESGELRKCLEKVMGGEDGEEIKKNARKWKDLAKDAVIEGGSSDHNLRLFAEEIGRIC